jgi:predicted ATP-dependent endonuclease of OLD family
VEFKGYRRLADTAVNVDSKLIAFVGPNEAGKSSILDALLWLHSKGELPQSALTRGRRATDEPVVRATFVLDEHDHEVLADLQLPTLPTKAVLEKRAGGRKRITLDPPVGWGTDAFEVLSEALDVLLAERTDLSNANTQLIVQVRRRLAGSREPWSEDDLRALSGLRDALPRLHGSIAPRAKSAADSLHAQLAAGPADHKVINLLAPRIPRFVLFNAAEQRLKASYDLDANESVQPLADLLGIAGTTVDDLKAAITSADIAARETYLLRLNTALQARLQGSWRQSRISVQLSCNGSTVHVLLKELHETGAITTLDERSEGLRTFIALMCFLYSSSRKVPPILLIDEAETHLHLDAQADLVEVLHGLTDASQVLYTTHSPGCLPPDLGTGIRLVAASRKNPGTSELRNDFWTNERPGFSSLLFKMGAGAAAFSACRHAVITEGPTEMILLPTLIKMATGQQNLLYQVAPGLSNSSARDPELQEVAAKTAYLVDGDAGGVTLKNQLIKAGVLESHVLSLPEGNAIEDLLTADSYLGAVNAHLTECSHTDRITESDLAEGKTRGKAVSEWCAQRGITPPGKTVIANKLVNNPDQISLEPVAVAFLKDLHLELTDVLKL